MFVLTKAAREEAQIGTLPGETDLGQIADVEYFQQKVLQAQEAVYNAWP